MDIKIATEAICHRNELRREAGLPQLDVGPELETIFAYSVSQDFDAWMGTPLRFRLETKLLARERQRRADPDWKPTGCPAAAWLGTAEPGDR